MNSMANVMLARQQRCALQALRGGRRQQLQVQQQQQQQRGRGRGRLFLSSSANHPNKGRPPMPRVMPTSTTSNPTTSNPTTTTTTPNHNPIVVTPSAAGTGRGTSTPAVDKALYGASKSRTPVTWTSLFVAAVTAASAVAYFRIERERRLEQALGKIVTSESLPRIAPDASSSSSNNNKSNAVGSGSGSVGGGGGGGGWTPKPDVLAPRQFVKTRAGWMPRDDGWGAPGKPAIGGPWSLVDLKGNLVTNESFKGKWLLLYFGFARCPDICPSEMNKVATVLDTLKQQYPALYKQIVPIFVSVDPARDSLQALADYAKDFHPDYIFLTGTPEQVQRMAKKYRVYMSKAEETEQGDYLVDHSIVIYLHDATGELADCLTQSMRPTDVVNKVVERMTFVPKY